MKTFQKKSHIAFAFIFAVLSVLPAVALLSSARAHATPMPLALFVPGTMSRSFSALADMTYEYKAPVFDSLAEAALKLNEDRPELGTVASPAWFMALLAEPFLRDVQSPVFSTRVIPQLDRALMTLKSHHGLSSITQFGAQPIYQGTAMRAYAASIRACLPFIASQQDQGVAQALITSSGRAIAQLEAGQGLDAELIQKLRDDSSRHLVQTLIAHPRTHGLGAMAALALGYLGAN